MTTVAIVQARMTSTRLPGKVLRPILGRPMLSFQIERLRRADRIDAIAVATTGRATDDAIVAFCRDERLTFTRGSEDDVLSRYYEAAKQSNAQTIVRITADCPLLDASIVDQVVTRFHQKDGGCDYASNMIRPTFPYGMAVEVVSLAALTQAHREARTPAEREHVTPFIYWRPDCFRIESVTMAPDLSSHRWTVDLPEDFALVSRILEALYPVKPKFELADVLALLHEHPEWEDLNRHIEQKAATREVR